MAHRLAPRAELDLDDIWHYLATNASIETADRLVDSLTTRFFLLSFRAIRALGGEEITFDPASVRFRLANTLSFTGSRERTS
jgi:plasmid stabilization system protein ParE